MTKKTVYVRTQLDNDLAEKLAKIKKELGVKKNTEVIRYLIINS